MGLSVRKHDVAISRLWLALVVVAGGALAGDASRPGKLITEVPTLQCLGVRWFIAGDANGNARVEMRYRKVGEERWRRGLDLFRVETRAIRSAHPPPGSTMFAGSVFGLEEDTAYELKLSLIDPDGGNAERVVRMRTWKEPQLPRGGRRIEVRPGGLRQALKDARPGDILLLHKGVYRGTFTAKSGEPGRPVALVAFGDGPAVLDGQGKSNIVHGFGAHDVIIDGLRFRNATWALAFNNASRITVRRCVVTECDYAFVAQKDASRQQHILIADNVFRGPCTWPRSKGIERQRGVQLSGSGHVVCHNRISNYADGIDTFAGSPTCAIDIYRNEISECTDDGIEMDYSEHNTRCFENRLTNVYQGISVQPVHGGPVYVFRNALYNVGLETFKMHNSPSGALFFHNTSVKAGMPLVLYTAETVSNCIYRNNLFVGTAGNYAYETTAPMRGCDFDYDAFAGQWRTFLKWNRVRYRTVEDVRQRAPVYRHVMVVRSEGLFASGVRPPDDPKRRFEVRVNDLRPAPGSGVVDRGVVLPNINDGFAGKAPDVGAYEVGQPMPHYGPRPTKSR